MPSIPGDWLTDLDGNRLLDEDANPIAEAAMQVLVVGGGYLVTVATGGAMSPAAGSLVLEGYVQLLKQLFPSGTEAVNVIDLLNAVKLNGDRWIPPSGLSYQAYMLEIETWLQANWPTTEPGGLTTEEHDKLLSISYPDTDLIASAIWGYHIPVTDQLGVDTNRMAETVVGDSWRYLSALAGYEGIPVPDRPFFRFCSKDPYYTALWLGNWTQSASTTDLPELDLSLIVEGDTVWSFLQREYPGYTWLRTGPGDRALGSNIWLQQGVYDVWYRCVLTDADLRSNPVTVTPPDVNVTVNVPLPPVLEDPAFERSYGATVAFTAPFVHVGACDGVIYTISTRGQGVKAFAVDGHTALTGAGVIGFTDSEGLPEKYQYMNFEAGVLVPQTMRRASGFFWSSNIALSGTVTPFTLVPITP